jgi:hypothetical protein
MVTVSTADLRSIRDDQSGFVDLSTKVHKKREQQRIHTGVDRIKHYLDLPIRSLIA